MGIEMAYFKDAGALVTTISGRVTFKEMIAHNEEVKSALSLGEVDLRIMDLRGLTEAEINTDQLDELAQHNLEVILEKPVKAMLVLAPQDLQYGLCRMWEAFTRLGDDALLIFRSADEVDAYLRENYGLDCSLLQLSPD